MITKRKKIYPFPEAIAPRKWTIAESSKGARVDIPRAVLYVPLDDTLDAEGVRAHELGHIKWSPKRPPKPGEYEGVEHETIQAVEDMRVNLLLRKVGIELRYTPLSPETLKKLESAPSRLKVLTAIAATGTGMAGQIRKRLTEKECKVVIGAAEILGPCPKFEDTLEAAKYVSCVFGLRDSIEEFLEHDLEEMGLEKIGAALEDYIEGGSYRFLKKVPWGSMEIEKLPMTERLPPFKLRRYRPGSEGATPMYFDRLTTDDKKIWGKKRQVFGLSILVDNSGSMELSCGDIANLLNQAPASVVARYASHPDTEKKGVLQVCAEKGKRVSVYDLERNALGGGNVVDYPALEWLAAQRRPRLWVSDGGVTGVGDSQGVENINECVELCLRAGIQRLDDMKAVSEWLRKHKKGRRMKL